MFDQIQIGQSSINFQITLLNISFRYVQSENTSDRVIGLRISDLFVAKVTGLPSCFRLKSDHALKMSVKRKF